MKHALFGLILAFAFVAGFTFLAGKYSAREDTAKAEARAAKVEAQAWADRPRNLHDAGIRLLERAERKRSSGL